MIRCLKDNRAQAVMGEYVLVFFLVLAAIVAMTIYFKRAVQARIHDSRDYMIGQVRERTRGQFDGNLYKEYEPYYTNFTAIITREDDQTVTFLPVPGLSSGSFQKSVNETTTIESSSETAPPRDFDLTTPTR